MDIKDKEIALLKQNESLLNKEVEASNSKFIQIQESIKHGNEAMVSVKKDMDRVRFISKNF